MTLGERICYYRTKQNMSQGDLADALEVSRQSVSKWETDSSIPDLNKLIKLSTVFNITLDELIMGTVQKVSSDPQPIPSYAGVPLPGRKIAGIVLFSMAFLSLMLITVAFGDLLSGLVIALPFALCGSICFLFHKHVGLWCTWALMFLLDIFLASATASNWRSLFVYFRGALPFPWTLTTLISLLYLLLLITLAIVTVFLFRKGPLPFPHRNGTALLAGTGVLLLSMAAESILLRHLFSLAQTAVNFSQVMQLISLFSLLIDWVQIAFTLLLLIYAFRLHYAKKA